MSNHVAWGSIVVAGLLATAVMTLLMYMGKAMGMKMDMPRMLGLMFAPPESGGAVYGLGGMAHFVMGVLLAIIYGVIFSLLNLRGGWIWGAIFGVVHAVLAGMFMAMMPAMHPRMGPGQELRPPGLFGRNYGTMVPVGLVMMHVIYGALVGGLYAAGL